jgi:uncharacterized membrane protein (UPF0182 family)
LRPFVPFSTNDLRTELQAYLTASSDPDTYGQLVSYVVDQEPLPAGPLRVADQAESEQEISRELTLLANVETQTSVRFGDLQLVPVGDGLLYVRPVYVVSSNVTEFRYVIVSTGTNAVFATDLESGLARLLPGFEGVIGDRIADGDEPVDEGEAPEELPAEGTTARQLLSEAEDLFAEADALLRDGDLGGYQETIARAQQKVVDAIAALEAAEA